MRISRMRSQDLEEVSLACAKVRSVLAEFMMTRQLLSWSLEACIQWRVREGRGHVARIQRQQQSSWVV